MTDLLKFFILKNNITKMKNHLYYSVLIVLIIGCTHKDPNYIVVEYNSKAHLSLIDSIIYYSNKDNFIGNNRDIEVIDDRIYISDKSKTTIHVLNENMEYQYSFGRYGEGPGEFTRAPYLTKHNDTLVIFDRPRKKLLFINIKDTIVNRKINLPAEYFYMVFDPVFINDRIIFAANNILLRELNNEISKLTTVLITDKYGKPLGETSKLLNDYYENSELLYFARNNSANISGGFDESFFSLQLATNKLQQFNEKGKLLKIYEYKPHFYEPPPNLKTNYAANNMEEWYEKFYSKITFCYGMFFDDKANLLFLGYRKLHPKQYLTKSFLDADNYLYVLNEKGECIFDEEIDGYLVSIDNCNLYILKEETDKRLVINKYKLEIKD